MAGLDHEVMLGLLDLPGEVCRELHQVEARRPTGVQFDVGRLGPAAPPGIGVRWRVLAEVPFQGIAEDGLWSRAVAHHLELQDGSGGVDEQFDPITDAVGGLVGIAPELPGFGIVGGFLRIPAGNAPGVSRTLGGTVSHGSSDLRSACFMRPVFRAVPASRRTGF
ncbi:hypothetical protein FQZ97_829600 [compost metagenome]